jgi:hypothetical protein
MHNERHERPGSYVRRVLFALCILHFALIAGACAKAQAKAAPDGPPLAVPAPPPRVLLPVEDPPLAENPPTQEESAPPPPRAAAPRPTPPRRAANQPPQAPPEEPKPDVPAAQAPSAEPVGPRPMPQTDAASERRIRDVMGKAATDLKRVDYQKLSADGKAQYEQSKRLSEQAEQALKERAYAFATTVADKAAAIATELLGAR